MAGSKIRHRIRIINIVERKMVYKQKAENTGKGLFLLSGVCQADVLPLGQS